MKEKPNSMFTDENIQTLFGYEDAESEKIERLSEYYFKKDTFERVTSDLPIRLLVGHKGTGKSALFKVAISEDKGRGNLPILIKPDDIAELGKKDENFLLRIRQWKYGLTKIIGSKVFNELGLYDETTINKLSKFGIKLITFITDSVKILNEKINLSATERLLVDNFLLTKKIIVYLDDLDRGWEGKKDDILRISALLNCVRDMANENPGLLFKISLRSDVFYLVRTSDESTDKIEGSIVWLKWTNHEILIMLVKRIVTFFGEQITDENLIKSESYYLNHYLDKIFVKRFTGQGKWQDVPIYRVLMSLIRKRPRDLVKLCSLAAHDAYNTRSNLITTENLENIFDEYSQGRIQDAINEYKSELPNIENLLFGMKPTRREKKYSDSYVFTTSDLVSKIHNISQLNNFYFASNKPASPKDLAQFLYKINFLTARKFLEDGTLQRKYFEENRYLSNRSIDFGYDWEIHPAFRWALQPDVPYNKLYSGNI